MSYHEAVVSSVHNLDEKWTREEASEPNPNSHSSVKPLCTQNRSKYAIHPHHRNRTRTMTKVKNWRRRADDDDEEEAAKPPQFEKESKGASKRKEVKKPAQVLKPSGSKLLSFAGDEEDDDGDGNGARATTTVSVARKERGNKALSAMEKGNLKQGASGVFRFGDDGQDGGMVLLPPIGGQQQQQQTKKKSGYGVGVQSSQKIELGKVEKSAPVKVASNVQALAGEYTKEKLLELQRNTKSLGAPKPATESKPSTTEPVVILKGLVKPVGEQKDDVAEVDRKKIVQGMIHHVEGHEAQAAGIRKAGEDDAEKRLGLMGIGSGADGGGITHIPDAAVIAAAKARRNQLRQAQAAPDYIPLNECDARGGGGAVVRGDGGEGEKDGEDSSEDEAEVHGRMSFLGENVPGKGQKGKGAAVFESVGKENELGLQEDEEADGERCWEEEQLRKGFGKRVDEVVHRVGAGALPAAAVHGGFAPGMLPMSVGSAGYGFGRSPMESLSIPQQAESAWKTLQENVKRLREGNGRAKSELHRTEEMLTSSLSGVASLEQSLASASEKYLYMQELRSYVSILCDFLQDKGPIIEELEEAMQRLHEERASALLERRIADNADEMAEIEVAVIAAKAALAKGAGTASAMAAASAASARDGRNNIAPQLDEFGRDVNLQKRLESKRRAQARERRAKMTAERRMNLIKNSNGDSARIVRMEGESSSEESESEEKAYKSGRQEILQTAESVYGDAAEEYSQLGKVKQRLEQWKQQYKAAYSDAYMQLSAPSIFAPYVRLELLHWDPLYGSAGFDSMRWYNLLFDYGVQGDGNTTDEDDADVNLIPKLVEKVALPMLHHELAHCWDVLSTEGSKRAVKAVQEMLIYVDAATSQPLQELLSAVHTRMANAVAALEVPSWSHQVTAAVPAAIPYSSRQFGAAVRLLRNLGLWKDILALPQLEHLALDQLLSGKMLVHLRAGAPAIHDAVTRIERVVAALTGVWVGTSFAELSPKLAPLIEYMLTITRAVEKRKDADMGESTIGLARRMKRVLVEVNEYDRARSLNKAFQLKEAL